MPMPAANDALLDAFAAYLSGERNYSPATLTAYTQNLAELKRLIGGKTYAAVAPQDIRLCVAKLASSGRAPRGIARALSAWRSFYRWGVRHRGFPANPAAGIRAPKAAKSLPKALSVDHAMALMERGATGGTLGASAGVCADAGVGRNALAPHEQDNPANHHSELNESTETADEQCASIRDAAMFELLYSSGLRLAELIGLDVTATQHSLGWINDQAGEVTVTGKGRKTRTVPVGTQALAALARWREARPAWVQPGDAAPLFLSPRGKRVSPSLVYTRLKRWTLKAGVPAHVHPHMLRHSFATHILQSSGDLRAVQELLGHANISTTQVYTHLDFQALAKVYDAAHPRAKKVKSE